MAAREQYTAEQVAQAIKKSQGILTGAALNRIGNSVPPLFMEAIARHIRQEILSKVVS